MTGPKARPGFYQRDGEPELLRWWNGAQWTDRTQPLTVEPAPDQETATERADRLMRELRRQQSERTAGAEQVAGSARVAAPGWYADEQVPGHQRWWDGTQWTSATQPLFAAPPVAWKKQRRVWPWLVAVVMGVLLCIVVAAALAPSRSSTESAKQHTQQGRLMAWSNAGGSLHVNVLGEDVKQTSHAAASLAAELAASGADGPTVSQERPLRLACRKLGADVRAAQRFQPLPEVHAQASWSHELTELRRAGDLCLRGTAPFDAALLGRSADAMRAASVSVSDVALALQAATGVAP